jgi:hypothetical protein
MKTTFLKSVFFTVLVLGSFSSCVKDDSYSIPELNCTQPNLTANRTVQQVINATTSLVSQYQYPDDVIEAYVVSSDEGGNFYKSISLQTLATETTPAVGFSVPVEASNTYIDYRPGVKVYVKMKDLYTDILYGSMRIGGIYVNSSSVASVGRLPQTEYKNKLIASCTNVSEETIVKKTSIANLLSDANLNTLVELSGVQFEDDAVGRKYYELSNDLGGATNWYLNDINGNKVIFRTSSYATYANHLLPTGNGTVRGVLTKYGSDYQFMARTEDDVKLTGDRLVPIFSETFTAGIGAWTAFSVVGAEVWAYSAVYGNPGAMAKMSGYATTNKANEDWLISPSLNLSELTAATLSFDNAYKFTGNPIEVYVSTNYPGTGSPAAAGVTWTALTGASLSQGNYVYVNSGALNLDAFTGAGKTNVRIAFKYTSTTSAASTWEIDNVKVIGD